MKNIVIVDDEIQILSMLEMFLKRNSEFSVRSFENPVNGLNHILSNRVDLVLLDIMMPQMDGLEVLNKIKSQKPNIKVIMMTAYSTLDRVLDAHKKEADSYIQKPFDSLANLNSKIEQTLRGK